MANFVMHFAVCVLCSILSGAATSGVCTRQSHRYRTQVYTYTAYSSTGYVYTYGCGWWGRRCSVTHYRSESHTTYATRQVGEYFTQLYFCSGNSGIPPDCQPICTPPCQNGGDCVAPGVCECPDVWNGLRCEDAICTVPCQHGGLCIAPNTCHCLYGWTGTYCHEAECLPPCYNGGVCVLPRLCICLPGWTGYRCELPRTYAD